MPRSVTLTFQDGTQHVFQNVPEETTPDMVEARASGQFPMKKLIGIDGGRPQEAEFAEIPGGAVTGIQQPPRRASLIGGKVGPILTPIAGAGAIGAAIGAATPEILTGLAGGLRQIPHGARVAPLIEAAAIAAKSTGRPATALSGLVSGLASETAGQALEAGGAPPGVSEAGRFVAGALTPELLPVARWAIDWGLTVYKKRLPTTIEESAARQLAFRIAAKLEGRPQDIDAEEAAYLNKLVNEMRGGEATDKPLRELYNVLQAGAKTRLAVGETEARTIMANANMAIQKELNVAIKSRAYTGPASERISQRGRTALATAQLQRLNIGDDLPPSDIGNALRSSIVARNQASILARRSEFAADEIARDTIVKAKETKGIFVNSLAEYRFLIADLSKNLTPGRRSPDVQRTYAKILSEIQSPEKDVFGQRKPISFQVLDDVRRRLGEVFTGKPAEGYQAISAADARKYYGMISNIQKKFGGEPQERLLKRYADASEGLEIFGSKAGKRLTALDRYDDTRFQIDAAALPRQFFSTKQGVFDLIELTGSRAEVLNAAKNFATAELNGLSEAQVRQWMIKRREMLAALPEVRNAVVKYTNHLQYGESTALNAERGVGRLNAYSQVQERTTQQRATTIEREARMRAGQITTQRGQEAISLLGPKGEMFPVQNVKALIESGTSRQWEQAAPMILASPGGREMLADSISQTLAEKALISTKGLSAFFKDNVRPALTATRLMDATKIESISAQLTHIENLKLPEPQKLGLVQRLILQAFGGYAASAAARGGTGLVNLIPPR